jgi:hypothetical protein
MLSVLCANALQQPFSLTAGREAVGCIRLLGSAGR